MNFFTDQLIYKKSRANKILTFVNIGICSFLILFLITVLICINTCGMPEALWYSDLTPSMKARNEGVLLILLYMLVILVLPLCICNQVISGVLGFRYLFAKYLSVYEVTSKNKKVWLAFALFFVTLVPVIFFWFLLPSFYHFYYSEAGTIRLAQMVEFKATKKQPKAIKFNFLFPFIFALVLIVASPSIAFGAIQIVIANKNARVPIRQKEMKQALTLAQDEPNTLLLYFDRSRAPVLAEVLAYDYTLFNKQNGIYKDDPKYSGTSFAELFPEFTQYLNATTLGGQTNISNPSINASWYYSPGLKDTHYLDPLTNIAYCNETINDWYATSYAFNFNLFKQYNYQNFNLFNIPYYGKQDYHTYANSQELEGILKKDLHTNNLNVFDQADTVVNFGHKLVWTQKDTVRNFTNLGAHQNTIANAPRVNGHIQLFPDDINTNETYLNQPDGFGANIPLISDETNGVINLSVSKNQHSNVIYFHNNFTHEPFAALKDNDYVNQYNPSGVNLDNPSIGYPWITDRHEQNQYKSMWWMIQKLKDIFVYLKNLPYTGPHSETILNQYDNLNIYIISDHGFHFSLAHKQTNEINNFLVQRGVFDQPSVDVFNDFINTYPDYPLMNCTLMAKPRKSIHSNWNKVIDMTHPLKNLIDTSTIISLGDLLPMIESDLQKNHQDNKSVTSNFAFNPSISLFKPSIATKMSETPVSELDQRKYDLFFKDKIIMDPLNHQNEILNRTIPMVYGSSAWHPYGNNFDIFRYFMFTYNPAFVDTTPLSSTFYNSRFFSVLDASTLNPK